MGEDARVVYSWSRSRREEVRATLTTFDGEPKADVRVYFSKADRHDATRRGSPVSSSGLPALKWKS